MGRGPRLVILCQRLALGGHRVTAPLPIKAVVVGVDVLFFRNRFWERAIVNVGIVLVFAAFYLRFLAPMSAAAV